MKYSESEIDYIVLSYFTELSYGTRFALAKALGVELPQFLKPAAELIKRHDDGVYNNVSKKFRDRKFREYLVKELERRGLQCITCVSEEYPEKLHDAFEPPLTLFAKGDVGLLKTRSLSIVGSRHTLPSILGLTRKFAKTLSRYLTIVSGIADGADTAALEGALEGGKVISVLACGLDHVSPAANADLKRRISQKGLLLSEYYPTDKGKSFYFPVRNRIIAGLSEATLVVSAGAKSGALITADFALEFNRDVYAFPYSPNIARGAGCNALIKEGAYLADSPEDILLGYGIEPSKEPEVELNERERAVLDAILAAGEAYLPDLADKFGMLPHELSPTLVSLEMKNLIMKLNGNKYAAK